MFGINENNIWAINKPLHAAGQMKISAVPSSSMNIIWTNKAAAAQKMFSGVFLVFFFTISARTSCIIPYNMQMSPLYQMGKTFYSASNWRGRTFPFSEQTSREPKLDSATFVRSRLLTSVTRSHDTKATEKEAVSFTRQSCFPVRHFLRVGVGCRPESPMKMNEYKKKKGKMFPGNISIKSRGCAGKIQPQWVFLSFCQV